MDPAVHIVLLPSSHPLFGLKYSKLPESHLTLSGPPSSSFAFPADAAAASSLDRPAPSGLSVTSSNNPLARRLPASPSSPGRCFAYYIIRFPFACPSLAASAASFFGPRAPSKLRRHVFLPPKFRPTFARSTAPLR